MHPSDCESGLSDDAGLCCLMGRGISTLAVLVIVEATASCGARVSPPVAIVSPPVGMWRIHFPLSVADSFSSLCGGEIELIKLVGSDQLVTIIVPTYKNI